MGDLETGCPSPKGEVIQGVRPRSGNGLNSQDRTEKMKEGLSSRVLLLVPLVYPLDRCGESLSPVRSVGSFSRTKN